MKKLVTLLGLFLVANFVLAQSLAPYPKQITLEKINVDAWAASIEKGSEDDLKDAFSAYIKKNFNLKSKKNGRHGLIVPEASLPQVTTRRGDLHVQFSNDAGRPEMAIAFMMGYDIYLNVRETPQEMERFKEFFTTFLYNYYKEYYEKQIRDKEKMIKDLRSQISNNEKKVKSLQNDIEKTQKKIAKESDQLKKTELENKNVVARRQIDALNEMNANNSKQINAIEAEISQIKMQIANIGK